MAKYIFDIETLEKMSNKELESIKKIDLIDYTVHVKTLAENADCQAYNHSVYVPSVLIKDIDEVECTLYYPLEEEHSFKIALDKMGGGRIALLNVDEILLSIANEYKVLWNDPDVRFWGHHWGDLWIERLILKGNVLEVRIGS